MVIAGHGVFAARSFWLPNDGRGSWSDQVWAEHLKPFGGVIRVTARHSLANEPHDRALRRAAKRALLYPPVRFNEPQIALIGEAIGEVVHTLHLKLYALAILHEHVHFVSARHAEPIEELIGFLKRATARYLDRAGLHPFARRRRANGTLPSVWVRGGWKRYLNCAADIADVIPYVEKNPAREGLPPQHWTFLTPFRWYRTSRSRDG
jgi:REP element-mobilizing transposase RayT